MLPNSKRTTSQWQTATSDSQGLSEVYLRNFVIEYLQSHGVLIALHTLGTKYLKGT